MHRSSAQLAASTLMASSFVLLASAPAAAQPCTGDNAAQNRYCGVPLIDGFGGANNYGTQCLFPNDDQSSTSIDLRPAFPTGLRFFAATPHTEMFVNTNGNISFGEEVGTYTPAAFPIADQPMIAPYWADVDIRGDGEGTGCSRTGTTCNVPAGGANGVYWTLSPGRAVITWDRTGSFACDDTRKMTFQLILTAAEGCSVGGDFDVEFRYAQCEWNTGTASNGTGGLSTLVTPIQTCTQDSDCFDVFDEEYHCYGGQCWMGVPGQAGFDAGNGTDFVEIAGSRTNDIHRILCEDSNVGMPGIYRFQIRGGAVVCPDAGQVCATGGMGVCGEGRTQCVGGGTTCQPIGESGPERCDALDNDCDGTVDEGETICADVSASATCESGSCIETCFEGGCPPGLECGSDSHCYEAGCEGVTCPEGERCSAGVCGDACLGVVCPYGQSCNAGRCSDLCATLTCDDCTVCEPSTGSCVDRCQFTACEAGEVCQDDGRCADEDCVGVTCPAGTSCREGSCVDACDGAVCPSGQVCSEGMCMPALTMPDAGMEGPDAGPEGEVDGGGTTGVDAGIDGGPACRGPGCDPDAERGCGCSAPGTGTGRSAGGVALAMLAIGMIVARRRRR